MKIRGAIVWSRKSSFFSLERDYFLRWMEKGERCPYFVLVIISYH